jgi:hypothetical protein
MAPGPQRTARSKFPRWLVVVLVVVPVLCVLSCVGLPIGVAIVGNNQRETYRKALDAVVLPPDIRRVSEDSTGTALCLDECVRVQRTYRSAWSPERVYETFATELRRLGYRCSSFCEWAGRSAASSQWRGPKVSASLSVDATNAWLVVPAGAVWVPRDPPP